MKKLLFLIPLLSLVATSCNKSNRIPDLPKDLDLYKKEYHWSKEDGTISCYGFTTFEYDGNLLIKKETYAYANERFSESIEYTYDEHDNLVTETVTHPDKSHTYIEYENTYDNQNRLTRVVTKNSEDKEKWNIDGKNEYEYSGRTITNKEYDSGVVLSQVTVYTFDNRGCLINRKVDFILEEGEGTETDYIVNDYGCVTQYIEYHVSDYVKGDIMLTATIEYLDNLWYRPTKVVIETCAQEPHTYHTEINEYNDQQQLILSKGFDGLDESQITDYGYYDTYEY